MWQWARTHNTKIAAAVTQGWSQRLVIGRSLVQFPWSACQSVPGQDTEPQTTPDVLVGTLHGSHHHQCMNVCVNYYTLRWTKASVKCCKCTNEWKIQKSTSRFYWYICVFPSVTSEKHLLLSQTKYLFWLSFWCLQGLANKGEDPKCRHNGSRLAENTHKKNILIQRNWSP